MRRSDNLGEQPNAGTCIREKHRDLSRISVVQKFGLSSSTPETEEERDASKVSKKETYSRDRRAFSCHSINKFSGIEARKAALDRESLSDNKAISDEDSEGVLARRTAHRTADFCPVGREKPPLGGFENFPNTHWDKSAWVSEPTGAL
jgi:hypothetical protein